MKQNLLKILVVTVLIIGIMGVSPTRLQAVNDSTIRLYNVAGQGLGTLIKGLIQGEVKDLKSAAKMLFWGSVSGYGFYEAKKMIGNGSVTPGIILANISASVSENTSRGDNPFAYIGYSIGPARLNIATPLAGKGRTIFDLQISPIDVIGFATAMSRADSISFRNGMISFEASEPLMPGVRGWAQGIYPTVVTGVPEHVFYHESIHVVQYIQTMAVSPQPLVSRRSREDRESKLFNVSLLNFNYVSILNGMTLNDNDPNSRIWNEVEAYSLAKDNR